MKGLTMTAETQILARTIYGEARGEYHKSNGGLTALIAIANVVMNRVKQKSWYGTTVQEVCQKPWQFSCWNTADPNFKLLNSDVIMDPLFDICLEVADKVLKGQWPDITKGCDHYYAMSMKTPPRWAVGKTPNYQVGNHLFFDSRKWG